MLQSPSSNTGWCSVT